MHSLFLSAPGMLSNSVIAKFADIVAEGFEPRGNSASYSETMLEANLIMIAKIAIISAAPQKIGNAGITQKEIDAMVANPVAAQINYAVLAPVIEELLFRGLPHDVSKSWKMGAASSMLFAFAHNFTAGDLNLSKLPVTQFLGGIYYWYLIRTRGLDHSILAHMANNNISTTAYYLLSRFP